MTTYGPITGIATEDLFDEIVNRIDETLSGNATGWHILKDGRAQSRIPTATDFVSFSSRGSVPEAASLGGGFATTYHRHLTGAAKDFDANLYYVLQYNIASSGGFGTRAATYVTSSDGVNFSSPIQWFGDYWGGGTGTVPVVTGIKMADGKYWVAGGYVSGGAAGNLVKLAWNGSAYEGLPTPVPAATVVDTAIGTDTAGAARPLTSGGHGFAFVESPTLAYMFLTYSPSPTSSPTPSDYVKMLKLEGADYAAAVANADTNDLFTTYLTASLIAVDGIFGIDYILDRGTFYEIFITVYHSSTVKTIKVRETNHNFAAPNFVVPSYASVYPSPVGVYRTNSVAVFDQANSLDSVFMVDYDTAWDTTTGTSQGDVFVQFFKTEVDGNPDSNGLEYEYVILKSEYTNNSGNGYYSILLRPNPNQSSPPTVTGITDMNAIFMRPIRGWDGNVPDHFYFDPMIPVGVDADSIDVLAPVLFATPDPMASPAETHKIYMRVTERQIFVHSESTNGTLQALGYNVLTPLVPMNSGSVLKIEKNDNVLAFSAGVETGVGAFYLGRNGFDEADLTAFRNTPKAYYGHGYMLSYGSMLNVQNPVDNKTYAFDIFVGNNAADLVSTPVSNFAYLPGKMFEAKFYTAPASVATGDNVTVNSIVHKAFKVDNTPGDVHNPVVPKTLLVAWN